MGSPPPRSRPATIPANTPTFPDGCGGSRRCRAMRGRRIFCRRSRGPPRERRLLARETGALRSGFLTLKPCVALAPELGPLHPGFDLSGLLGGLPFGGALLLALAGGHLAGGRLLAGFLVGLLARAPHRARVV